MVAGGPKVEINRQNRTAWNRCLLARFCELCCQSACNSGGTFNSAEQVPPNRTPTLTLYKGTWREVVAREGIEPPTRGFSVRCSTN
jgi:hypothetical protein